jgi:hypothetical protein
MHAIWLPRYYEKFPFLQLKLQNLMDKDASVSNLLTVDDEFDVSPIVLRDDLTYTTEDGDVISRSQKIINHTLLLSLASENVATGIDEKQVQIIQHHYERLQQQYEAYQRFHQRFPHNQMHRICKPTHIKIVEVPIKKKYPNHYSDVGNVDS